MELATATASATGGSPIFALASSATAANAAANAAAKTAAAASRLLEEARLAISIDLLHRHTRHSALTPI